ncbi:MAG: YncE family protein [Chloroflexi bacterium]|nr:YncE family protein [Chloroflexota bacterium]
MKPWAAAAAVVCVLALGACSSSPSFHGTIFVAATNSSDVAVVDGDSMKVLARISLPGKPHGVDLEPGGKRVWTSNIEGDTVSVIDVASRTVSSSIKVCMGPMNVAFAVGRAFAACGDGYMAVIDTTTLAVLKTEAIGHAPHQIIAGPGGRVWSVNRGSNDLSEIDPAEGTLLTRHPAGPFAYDAVFAPNGKYAFVTSKTWGAVSVLKTDDWQILGSIKVGSDPALIAISPDGKRLYVTNRKDGTVSVINALTFQVVRTIRVEQEPGGIALSADGRLLFVANFASNTLSVIDTSSNEVVRSVPVGEAPDDIVLVPSA